MLQFETDEIDFEFEVKIAGGAIVYNVFALPYLDDELTITGNFILNDVEIIREYDNYGISIMADLVFRQDPNGLITIEVIVTNDETILAELYDILEAE